MVKPFWEHLEDLRWTLIKSIIALFIGFNICMVFAKQILQFLKAPLHDVYASEVSTNAPSLLISTNITTVGGQAVNSVVTNLTQTSGASAIPDDFLQTFDVMGGFMLWMKLALYGGIVLAGPFMFYFLAQFVLPALKRQEKKLVTPVFIYGTLLFMAGAAVTYYGLLPTALKAFLQYNKWLEIKSNWRVESYIEFVTQFMLAMGLTFEMPLVVLVLVRLGIISAATVQRSWRIMVVVAGVIAAIVAPADPGSMLLMMLPMIVLILITIWLAWIIEGRRKKARGESPDSESDTLF